MADIQYLNYGDLQIELLALLNKLADLVQGYVQKQPWSAKRKLKFMSAYSDIMNRGLLGASNTSGQWTIDINGEDIDFSLKDDKDREMYGEAAYFILLQMAGMPTKASLEEEQRKKTEKEKSELPIFDNTTFKKGFINQLSKDYFGGSEIHSSKWNEYDKRGENGLRGRTNRALMLIDSLERYALDIELNKDKYNFEDSPFGSLDEFKNRIAKAKEALINTPNDTEDDFKALNALGLNASDYFNDGSGDPYKTEGYEGTYGGYYNEYLPSLEKKKAEEVAAKLKAIRANLWDRMSFWGTNLYGKPLSAEHNNLEYLQGLINKPKLNGDEQSELVGLFKLAAKNGQLLSLSKEELEKFGRFLGYNNPNRLRKVNGLEGVYWDTIGNRIVRPYMSTNAPLSGIQDLLELNSPEALAKKEQDNKLKAANRKLSEGWETEDYARMLAMGLDIVGSLAAWAPGYGTAASGILGLTSLGTNMVADIADESMSGWDVAKNAGVNLGLAAVGMVPGLGLASKTGKWITNIAKWAPRLLTLQAIKDLPDSYNSLQKAINKPNELTNADWRNIAYGLSIVAGLSRGASGFAKNRIYKPAFTENTEKQYTITTSKGKKTITLKLVDEIKKLNPKDKENYNKELKKTLGLAEDETVNMKDVSILGKTIKEKGIDIKEENVPVGLSTKAKAYREYLENRNNAMKNGEGIYKYAPRFLKTDYDIYKANTQRSVPDLGISDKLKNFWNPLSDKNLLKKGIKVEETKPTGTSSKTSETTKTELKSLTPDEIKLLKEVTKEYRNVLSGKAKHSGNNLSEEPFKAGDFTFEVSKFPNSSGGNIDISFNGGNKTISFKDLKDLMTKVALFLKENRKLTDTSGSIIKKINSKEMGEILKLLKAKGVFKQGGTIDKQRIQRYKEFINK